MDHAGCYYRFHYYSDASYLLLSKINCYDIGFFTWGPANKHCIRHDLGLQGRYKMGVVDHRRDLGWVYSAWWSDGMLLERTDESREYQYLWRVVPNCWYRNSLWTIPTQIRYNG